MKKALILCMFVSLAAQATLSEADLERGYRRMPWGVCNKPPLAGTEAEDKDLRLEDFRHAGRFLTALSNYVYSFDREYLVSLSEIITKSEHGDLLAIFVLNAAYPYLNGLQYLAVKERYLDSAMENLRCLNQNFGIQSLDDMRDIQIFQEAATRYLMKSLHSSRPMLSDAQKATSSELVQFFGDILAKGITAATLADLRNRLPGLVKMEEELAQNVFLRSRAAGDILVAKYLEEK